MGMKIYSLKNLTYVIRYPEGFDEQKKYPVILCLHGAGARGDDVHKVMTNPFFTKTEHLEIGPFVFVAPLCSKNTWFDLWEQLETLVTQIAQEPFTDRKRIYLMGASMGGYAVWQLAMSMPEYFAAIAPVCGGGMYWNAGRLVNVPVWAFHGAQDLAVLPEESRKMVDAVNRTGGHAKLTVYPEVGHNAWNNAYSDPELFAWFLRHENNRLHSLDDSYDNVEMYG